MNIQLPAWYYVLLVFIVTLLGSSCDASDFKIAIGNDSRYISEGRDNTSEVSLQHVGLNQSLGDFSACLWYARSNFNDYRELNLSLSHRLNLGEFSLVSAYTFLDFSGSDPDDHELSLDLSSGDTWLLEANLSTYYSYRSKGVYALADLSYLVEINPQFFLAPYLSLGTNYGYVVDEHRGADHYGFGMQAELILAEALRLSAYIAAIEPIEKASNETLLATQWWGASLTHVF